MSGESFLFFKSHHGFGILLRIPWNLGANASLIKSEKTFLSGRWYKMVLSHTVHRDRGPGSEKQKAQRLWSSP
jgi:hypothetical protein